MLRVSELRKRLGNVVAVDQVSLTVDDATIATIAGENGAGKSTLLRLLTGVLSPDRGSIELDGQSLTHPGSSVRRRVGYVPEAADPPGYLSASELFRLVAAIKDCSSIGRELVEKLGIEMLLDRRIGELSLGERRRVCLAAALIGGPRLLVLDEPTNGLDPSGIEELAKLLREQRDDNAIVVLATHDREFANSIADTKLTMERGRLTE